MNCGNSPILLHIARAIEQMTDVSQHGKAMLRAVDAGGEVLAGRICRVSAGDLEAIRHNSDVLVRVMQEALRGLERSPLSLHLAAGALVAHDQLAVILREIERRPLVAYTQKTSYAFVPFVVLFLYGRQFAGTEMLLEALSPELCQMLGTKGY